jgi:PAS domain S-box-containing protein
MKDIKEIIKYSSRLQLLYVEDNEDARGSTVGILEEFFKEVLIAENGEEGFEKFQNNDIDIIITDINMPKLNGLKMIEKIREIDSSVYILVLSAYNESGFFMESIRLGVEGYILKPIELKQFVFSMDKITSKIALEIQNRKSVSLLHQYQEATDGSSIVSKTDLEGNITYVNDEFCKISEYSREELIGKNHNITRHPDNTDDIYRDMWDTIKNRKEMWKGTLKNISKSGKIFYVKTVIKPILDINGELIEYIALRDDITDIMNPMKQLNDFIRLAKTPILAVIELVDYIHLENFYGYHDISIIEEKITEKLFEYLPKDSVFEKIFMLGRGKFAFVAEGDIDKERAIDDIKMILHSVNSHSFNIDNAVYDISIRVSISYDKNIFENCVYGLKELNLSGDDFIIANNLAELEKIKAQKNLDMLDTIYTAIENNKIVSYFQPIIDNKTQEILKYESLVRLIDKDGNILSPAQFLDVAKEGRFYSRITQIVLKNSFEALYKTDKEISMNLSALDIEKESIVNEIYNLLDKHKEHANRVIFELLEDEDIKNIKLINEFITKVKHYGVKIAIDDFGSGYSNFGRLAQYQPDILKIDGSLIKNILHNSYSLSIVKTIIAFAKTQNLQIVGEYVENRDIYEFLKELGIDYSQGYYFAKPEPLP